MWQQINGKEGEKNSVISHSRWTVLAILHIYIYICKNSSVCLHISKYQSEQKRYFSAELYKHQVAFLRSQHRPDVPGQWIRADTLLWETVQSHFSWQSSGWCGLRKDFSDVLFLPFLSVFHVAWAPGELCKMRLYVGLTWIFQKDLIFQNAAQVKSEILLHWCDDLSVLSWAGIDSTQRSRNGRWGPRWHSCSLPAWSLLPTGTWRFSSRLLGNQLLLVLHRWHPWISLHPNCTAFIRCWAASCCRAVCRELILKIYDASFGLSLVHFPNHDADYQGNCFLFLFHFIYFPWKP